MTLAPPRPPSSDELEALIREARARQRKRWAGAAAVLALLAGAAVGLSSIVAGGSPSTSRSSRGSTPAVKSGSPCGVRGKGVRILDAGGRTVYREPGHFKLPNSGRPEIRCSGSAIWAVWDNGAGMMQEAYVGARSLDGGQTWKLVFTEGLFGPKAPHQLDSQLGPWALRGHAAYFTGWCPACSTRTSQGTNSLWVTKDGGQKFRRYKLPALTGYAPAGIRILRHEVTILGTRFTRGTSPRKTVTVHVA